MDKDSQPAGRAPAHRRPTQPAAKPPAAIFIEPQLPPPADPADAALQTSATAATSSTIGNRHTVDPPEQPITPANDPPTTKVTRPVTASRPDTATRSVKATRPGTATRPVKATGSASIEAAGPAPVTSPPDEPETAADHPPAAGSTAESSTTAGSTTTVASAEIAGRTTSNGRVRTAKPAKKAAARRSATPTGTAAPASRAPADEAAAPAAVARSASAPAKKAARKRAVPAQVQPEPEPGHDPEPVARVADTTAGPQPPQDRVATGSGTDGTLWQRVLARPEYAAEVLALAAVRRLGPPIAREAEWLRATYPHAGAAALARYVQRRQVRRAGYAALLGTAAGLVAPAARLAAVLYCQGQLILGTAAAFGLDPTDPDRAAELLTILAVRPSVEQARSAIAAADAPADQTSGDGGSTDRWRAGWRVARLAGTVRLGGDRLGGAAALRLLSGRRLTGAARLLAAVSVDTASLERTARRADTFYRAIA